MARHGLAGFGRRGPAGRGLARRGKARHGKVWQEHLGPGVVSARPFCCGQPSTDDLTKTQKASLPAKIGGGRNLSDLHAEGEA